jgi:hypothetical protein
MLGSNLKNVRTTWRLQSARSPATLLPAARVKYPRNCSMFRMLRCLQTSTAAPLLKLLPCCPLHQVRFMSGLKGSTIPPLSSSKRLSRQQRLETGQSSGLDLARRVLCRVHITSSSDVDDSSSCGIRKTQLHGNMIFVASTSTIQTNVCSYNAFLCFNREKGLLLMFTSAAASEWAQIRQYNY